MNFNFIINISVTTFHLIIDFDLVFVNEINIFEYLLQYKSDSFVITLLLLLIVEDILEINWVRFCHPFR